MVTDKQRGNLRLFGEDRSQSEARDFGRAGGIKSGQVRRVKRTFKELCECVLDCPVQNEAIIDEIIEIVPDLKREEVTYKMAILIPAFRKAAEGDLKALEIIRDTVEGKPVAKQEVSLWGADDKIVIHLDGEPLE